MEPTEEEEPGVRHTLGGAGLAFAGIALVVGVDLVLDARAGTDLSHLATEGFAAALALLGAVVSWRRWQAETRHAREALGVAARAARRWEEEATRWRHEAEDVVRGLGAAIDRQFERWGLTSAEREVGMLLLKGLSHKEIGAARGTSERTAREQARAVYSKAGLAGRAELAAFFLEDLLPAGRQ